jgi:hypothetical protein
MRAVLLLVACGSVSGSAVGQELVLRFRQARIRRVALDLSARYGMRLEVAPVQHLPVPSDFVDSWLESRRPVPEEAWAEKLPAPASFVIDSVRVFSRLERVVFSGQYREARWAFMQGRRLTAIDTTRTGDIRARMQAAFGSPTHTLAEMDSVVGRPTEEIVQFEYWMVVNDSIPVMILDVNGPLGRGVVVAIDARWRDELDAVRYGLLQPLFNNPRRAPYVDYFYQVDDAAWYATGFDGATSFLRRIEAPNLAMGRPELRTYAPPPENR